MNLRRAVQSKLSNSSHLLLLLDYDGTLTPIVRTPKDARLTPQVRTLLKKFVRTSGVTLAIVSGRMLHDVKKKVGVQGVIYAGNHGLELAGGGYKLLNREVRKAKPILRQIARVLRGDLKEIPNAWVEDKILTLSVHYRQVKKRYWPQVTQLINQITQPWRKRGLIKLTKGKCVIEVRPNTSWDKGAAVRWLIKKMKRKKRCFSIYIGARGN